MSSTSGIHRPVSETKHLAAGSSFPEITTGLMRLYSMRFCPYAQRTRLVLAAKRIPHEVVNCNLFSKPEWYFARNPLGKVPCLEFNGNFIFESLITADYLDEVYPDPPLNSNDPLQKAKDRIFIELFNKVSGAMYKLYFAKGDLEILKKCRINLEEGLSTFEEELTQRGTPFFGGLRPGILDYMIWPWVERLPVLPILSQGLVVLPKDQIPLLMKWYDAMTQDDAVKESFISAENHAKYLESHLSGTPDYDMEL
nr:GSTomega protein [Diaphanosoma celebensis]